jgi:hypothetical protein
MRTLTSQCGESAQVKNSALKFITLFRSLSVFMFQAKAYRRKRKCHLANRGRLPVCQKPWLKSGPCLLLLGHCPEAKVSTSKQQFFKWYMQWQIPAGVSHFPGALGGGDDTGTLWLREGVGTGLGSSYRRCGGHC